MGVELAKNIVDVLFDGSQGNHQFPGNFPVGIAGGDKSEYFKFALAQRLNQFKFGGLRF